MRTLLRWLKRGLFLLVAFTLFLIAPVGYVELACQGPETEETYRPIIGDPAWQRAESRTLMTYPEWHIVHAYDDFAKVISTNAPHDFGYIRSIVGFWTTLCPLSKQSAAMGGVTNTSKMTIYTIGVSFSAELLAKAAYEETIGRLVVMIRGPKRANLDDLYATQAADYALFLQQTPWYYRDFSADAAALNAAPGDTFRDQERRLALGLEYGVKGAYGELLKSAVAQMGEDAVRMRVVVSGLPRDLLESLKGVAVIEDTPEYTQIETDRFRLFTRIAEKIAAAGGDFVEIAGNDEILFTALSDRPTHPDALYSFARQGYGDYRHLIVLPVRDLADRLRNLGELRLEHVHDY